MKFVFWQNMLSIHQTALINKLSVDHEVILVAEKSFLSDRKNSGWDVPDMGDARMFVAPTDIQIKRLIDYSTDFIHVFSGISAFPMVYKAFKRAVSKEYFIIVYAEPYEYSGLMGFLRRVKYIFLAFRYRRYIRVLLVTGKTGVAAFRKACFSDEKIFEWGYFTE